jgi:hypothetical protein
MPFRAPSPRLIQVAVLALLVTGIVLLVLQQRRIGELEARLVTGGAVSASVASAAVVPAPARLPLAARSFEPVRGGEPGSVVMSGLTKEEAMALAERLQPPLPPPVSSVSVPTFLAKHRIGPALWKEVQASNARTTEQLYALGRTFPSGSIEETEARLATIESERKAAVAKLLKPEQLTAYEAMRATGGVDGVVTLASGAVTRWVYRY